MTPCVEWTGYTLPTGYGQCTWKQRKWLAHRKVMAELHGEDAIRDQVVRHVCDVRTCVNPDHLRVGTQRDNVQDMFDKGRGRNGNESKTHCPQGHPYIEQNMYIYGSRRVCRTCALSRSRASVKRGRKKGK